MDKNINTEDNSFTFTIVEGLKEYDDSKYCETANAILNKVIPDLGDIEDFSHKDDNKAIYKKSNPARSSFFESVSIAFNSHYTLKLSVSHILVQIGQALSMHINENSEKFRKIFVSHEGQKELNISRDEFRLGEKNDWTSALIELCDKIK